MDIAMIPNVRFSAKTRRFVASLLCVGLAIRVAALFAEYVFGIRGTGRFHVETAALIFVVVGLAVRLTTSGKGHPPDDVPQDAMAPEAVEHHGLLGSRFSTWAGFTALGLVLYWPALWIGFLSDDFVLAERAAAWNLGPVTPVLFRPLPLFLWGAIVRLGGAATTIHLLNVVAHGTNAFLVTRVTQGWIPGRRWSLLAGLLFLTSPLGPEAVIWASGVFDVLSTTLLLALVLVARTYRGQTPLGRRLAILVLGLGALMCKETSVIAPALLLIDAWVRNRIRRPLLVDTAVLSSLFAMIALQRLFSAFGVMAPRVDKYALQRGLFGSFGSLATPWHLSVIHEVPWLLVLHVAVLLGLVTLFCIRTGFSQRSRIALAGVAWILISVLPVWPILGVTPDLQGARYLYLAACGWAVLLAALATPESPAKAARQFGIVALVAMSGFSTWATWRHSQPWREAGKLRELIERSVPNDGCATLVLSNLPDNVEGAYVFRNGAREAFARNVGRDISVTVSDGLEDIRCSFAWNQSTLSFVRQTK